MTGPGPLVRWVLLLASSLTVMAGSIITPALPAIGGHFSDSADWLIPLVLTLPALVIALVAPFVGTLADRFGRRRLLLLSLAIYGVGGTVGAFTQTLSLLLVSRAILGVGVAGIMSVSTTLIGDYFSGAERQRLIGLQGTFMALGGVVFLTLGGALAELGWRGPFIVYLVALLLLPLAAWKLFEPDRSGEQHSPEGKVPPKTPLLRIAGVYGLGFFSMMSFYIMPTQFPFLVLEKTGRTNFWVGLAIGLATLAAAFMGLAYGKLRARPPYTIVQSVAFAGMGLGFMLMFMAETYTGLVVACIVGGLGGGLMLPNLNMWLMELAPTAVRGRVMGGYSSVFFLGQFVSPLAAAPVVMLLSLNAVFLVWAFGLWVVSTLLVLVTVLRR